MKKNTIITILLAVILIVGVYTIFLRPKNTTTNNNSNQKVTLYYSLTCPHCKNVDDYLAQNKVEEKLGIKINQLEVSQSQPNAQKLYDQTAACNLPTDPLSVPLLWDGKNCYSGDEPIINYFADQLK